MTWFVDKLGPAPEERFRSAGAPNGAAQPMPIPESAPRQQTAAPKSPAPSRPGPAPEPEKKKKKGWF